MMKSKLLSCAAAAAIVLASANAMAGDHGKMKHDGANKPVSKVSEVQNMADDSMVYVQGYIIQNLGNDNYMLQDGSGQIMVEIDDDLMNNATITPQTVVWIAATVDQETGQPVSLEAEEIQIMPEGTNIPMAMNNK
jgi:uncharacterized protein (TIGR00156 family)